MKINFDGQELEIDKNPDHLTLLGGKYYADKATWHKYTHVYKKIFDHLGYTRDSPITFLEIGFSLGSSHLMWREYFPNATIIAIDIKQWRWYQEKLKWTDASTLESKAALLRNFDNLFDDKFQLFVGDQKDPSVLQEICDKFGEFDIILDDASHKDYETMVSFKHLFPYLKNGSPYIIEDIGGGASETRMERVRHDIQLFNDSGKFNYLDHGGDVSSTSLIRMAYDLGLSESKLPPLGNGASDFGIIVKK